MQESVRKACEECKSYCLLSLGRKEHCEEEGLSDYPTVALIVHEAARKLQEATAVCRL